MSLSRPIGSMAMIHPRFGGTTVRQTIFSRSRWLCLSLVQSRNLPPADFCGVSFSTATALPSSNLD
jgi:hypothetical protein